MNIYPSEMKRIHSGLQWMDKKLEQNKDIRLMNEHQPETNQTPAGHQWMYINLEQKDIQDSKV